MPKTKVPPIYPRTASTSYPPWLRASMAAQRQNPRFRGTKCHAAGEHACHPHSATLGARANSSSPLCHQRCDDPAGPSPGDGVSSLQPISGRRQPPDPRRLLFTTHHLVPCPCLARMLLARRITCLPRPGPDVVRRGARVANLFVPRTLAEILLTSHIRTDTVCLYVVFRPVWLACLSTPLPSPSPHVVCLV